MLKLFMTFAKIGFLAFGGGWSIIGIIQSTVLSNNWLTPQQFKEILSVAQMTPGPVFLNLATYLGLKMYGIKGAILNSFSVLVAPITFTTIFFLIRNKVSNKLINALKFGVIFLIILTIQSLALRIDNAFQIILILLAFILFTKTKIDPIYIILLSGIIGYFLF
ncbi:chromate transporter [Thermosipho affectus]|uniref:Chromate transporter n=1 Tax=Thermosipho affectus TaxID=660294 RepID=A0ABX3IJ02_9BACT|nr:MULTISPECIES: chromate transporter [Thermosipho]ANQ53940.1 chromate transporter [Thermosipho sp. 1070]ONN27289.1 chromate transporter [Thermosipho affectus]OOC43628.1 chromate transporter [Thermosipho sp. 1074]